MWDFIALVSGPASLYGLCPDTLNSLIISLLPSVDHSYQEMGELSVVDDSCDVRLRMMQQIVQALRKYTGFFIPKVGIVVKKRLHVIIQGAGYPLESLSTILNISQII